MPTTPEQRQVRRDVAQLRVNPERFGRDLARRVFAKVTAGQRNR